MSTNTQPRKQTSPVPCRFYARGSCREGTDCKFSHDILPVASGGVGSATDTHAAKSTRRSGTSFGNEHQLPCRYWKAGNCTKGLTCRFAHDADTSNTEEDKHTYTHDTPPQRDHPSRVSRRLRPSDQAEAQGGRSIVCRLWKAGKCARGDECWYLHSEQDPTDSGVATATAETITRVVQGSIVTYSPGLDILSLITGFESCTLRIKNLPDDTKDNDVCALFKQQGLTDDHFCLVRIRKTGEKQTEAEVLVDAKAGEVLSTGLDGIEFRDVILDVDMSTTSAGGGMASSSVRDATVLTLSWRGCAVQYVADYIDEADARAKVRMLNGHVLNHRRVKVEMNSTSLHTSIRLSNISLETTDAEIMAFTGTSSVKRLRIEGSSLTARDVADTVRDLVTRIAPEDLRALDQTVIPNLNGLLSIRIHFGSREGALAVQRNLQGRRYGKEAGMWYRLPHPMDFTISIRKEQYTAQKAQWAALTNVSKDPKACMLNILELDNFVRIRLVGSQKDTLGALKVRVEGLARGEAVEGWHRSLARPGNKFVQRVIGETGAYLRADLKMQVLKVYGSSVSVAHARQMISDELTKLASMDYTTTIPKHVVGAIIREGLAQLKETFGEDSIKFDVTSRRITITGGEEARHMLDSFIQGSLKDNHNPPGHPRSGQTCPVCYDDISTPFQLGCGHAYCVACLHHFLVSALEGNQFPLVCLGNDGHCKVPISIPTIKRFLNPALFNHLLEVAFKYYVSKHPKVFKFCKTPDCTQIYRSTSSGTAMNLRCPSCFSEVCSFCDKVHEGKTCAEHKQAKTEEEDRLNDAWIAAQGGRVKKCPECGVPIEKMAGCNHMTCGCGAHICWRCMGVFTANTIYRHMSEAHQGFYDDEPIIQGVDIQEQYDLLRRIQDQNTLAQRMQPANVDRRDQAPRAAEQQRVDMMVDAARRRLEEVARRPPQWEELVRQRQHREEEARRQQHREQEARRRQHQEEDARQQQQLLRRQQERVQHDSGNGWNCLIM